MRKSAFLFLCVAVMVATPSMVWAQSRCSTPLRTSPAPFFSRTNPSAPEAAPRAEAATIMPEESA